LRVVRLALAVAALAAVGCDDGAGGSTGGTLRVFAAASLTDAFEELAERFESAHDGVEVELNLAASSSLREQILAGAPADVFASADELTMQAVVDAGLAPDATPFATNELQIAVPAGNPGAVTGLADFADDDLLLGLCAPEVPCGRLAREALERAGVVARPDTEEPDVRSLLTKVAEGDLDAGVVYRTDVLAPGGDVEGVAIPDASNVVVTYPIAALADAVDGDLADVFVAFVLGAEGRAVLDDHGFGAP
jgi:molybdate transport system substrate-binding protein